MTSPKRRRDPEATRSRILQAAAELLVQGDGALEMSWVAKAAGVSQGLAYHHFGSKEGLLAAVVDDFYDRLEADVLMTRLDEITDWEQREAERTRRYINYLMDDPLGPVVVSRLALTPAIAGLEAQRWHRLVTVGARNIAEGQRSGQVAADEDSELLAAMVLGAMRAGVTRAMTNTQSIDRDALARDTWQFLRRGLLLHQGG